MDNRKKEINWYVFIPTIVCIGGAALIGIINNEWLTSIAYFLFGWTLTNFAWLYQIIAIFTLIVMVLIFAGKTGRIRLGDRTQKLKFLL